VDEYPHKPVPKTGDDYSVVLWLALAAISLPCLLVSAVFLCKKKRPAVLPFVLSGALLLGSAFMALTAWKEYGNGIDAYAETEQFVVLPELPEGFTYGTVRKVEVQIGVSGTQAVLSVPVLPTVDFAALRSINPDIVGWLICEGTDLNYPVAQGRDNSRYLHYLYDGTKGKAGTPFLDFENNPGFSDKNNIIYGHTLLNGSMFSCLADYREQAYYELHPIMLLLTPESAFRMEIFAVFTASPNEAGTGNSPWRQAWGSDRDFAAWLARAQGRSVIRTDVEVSAEDVVLTLSTCTNRGRDRLLVMGKLVPVE